MMTQGLIYSGGLRELFIYLLTEVPITLAHPNERKIMQIHESERRSAANIGSSLLTTFPTPQKEKGTATMP